MQTKTKESAPQAAQPDATKTTSQVEASSDDLVLGLTVEETAAVVSASFALAAIVISVLAMRAAAKTERELRDLRADDLTDKMILLSDGQEMVAMREWLQTKLVSHATAHKCMLSGGLKQLNVGQTFPIPSAEGTRHLMAGQICIKVLQFYGRVARQITERRVDNERIIDAMADDIIAAWRALLPYLKPKTVGDYYRWFRRRYSMASVAMVLIENQGHDDRIAILRKRPSIWMVIKRKWKDFSYRVPPTGY